MTNDSSSTRRSFLKAGAVVAVPLAAAPAAALADDGFRARLARLEDEAAVRALHQDWLRRVNGRAGDAAVLGADVRGIAPDHAIADAIEIAADGKSAAGRFHCAVQLETELALDCTLAQMAHAQGEGVIRTTERRVLTAQYVKAGDGWSIAKLGFASA